MVASLYHLYIYAHSEKPALSERFSLMKAYLDQPVHYRFPLASKNKMQQASLNLLKGQMSRNGDI